MFIYYPEYFLCPDFEVTDIDEELSRGKDYSEINFDEDIDVYENIDDEYCNEAVYKENN